MAVILTSPVEGKQIGETYTGPNEQYHVENGNAKWKSPHAAYNGVFTGVEYDHSTDDDLYDAEYEPTPSIDGYVAPVDESLVVNGTEVVHDFEPNVYGAATPSTDGHLPATSDPGVDPFADER